MTATVTADMLWKFRKWVRILLNVSIFIFWICCHLYFAIVQDKTIVLEQFFIVLIFMFIFFIISMIKLIKKTVCTIYTETFICLVFAGLINEIANLK